MITLKPFHIVYKGGTGEIIVKKSKFIANVLPIKTEEDANLFIEKMKKKHYNAAHNCFAYTIGMEDEITRCSDDGEPSRTAGLPMLNVLLGEQLHNVVVVVTRYFGGTLLGTGGLVRAYQEAVKEGLKNCTIIEKQKGIQLQLELDYTLVGKIQYLLSEEKIPIIDSSYTDIVSFTLVVPFDSYSKIQKSLIEATNGRIEVNQLNEVYFANVSGETLLFDI